MKYHDVGDEVKVTAVFTDPDNGNAALDPTAVKFDFTTPAGLTTTYIYGTNSELVKDSTGNYHVLIDAATSGIWTYRWYSTGTGKAADDGRFDVIAARGNSNLLVSNAYCTIPQLIRWASSQGIENWADHQEDGNEDHYVVSDAINRAVSEMNLYLLVRYDAATLAAENIVQHWCVIIASYFLSQTRANSPSEGLKQQFDRLMNPQDGILSQVASGKIQLAELPMRSDLRPTMSNVDVDRRYHRSTIRVTRANSSRVTTNLTQDKDHSFPGVFD